MAHAQQDLSFRRGAMCALALRLWCGIGLALAIGIWTSPEAWALTVSPTSMTFQAVQGGTNPYSGTVNVSKSNNHQATWTATDSATWLTVSPGTGSITSTALVAMAVNITGLAAGTYTTTVNIKVDKGGSASIPVTLTVTSGSTTNSTSPTQLSSSATTATLSWAPSTSTNASGYKVYMGTASGVYSSSITVGNTTTYTSSNLGVGHTYYFAVTAYNGSGIESSYSSEVSKSIY